MHVPVLFQETLDLLITDPDGIYVDCTLGGGGHFAGIIEKTGDHSTLIGIDQDPEALVRTRARIGEPPRATLIKGNFRDLRLILSGLSVNSVDGILIDLGVSSFQLDQEAGGFSYHLEGRLDMRMDPDQEVSAWDLVNRWPAERLQEIIREYGEERFAGRIARAIAEARRDHPLESTLELAEVIRRSVPAAYRRESHPARRTFQALRIAVNQELQSLELALPQAVGSLKAGGRLCVISFHSLEDRIVKDYFNQESKSCLCPGKQPICTCGHKAIIRILTRKPVVPTPEEVAGNNRARSAKLRAVQKLEF